MKHTKKIIVSCALALTLVATSVTAFASTVYNTPAEAVAGVTGKTLDQVISERQSGKSYGTIANEAGKLPEFQQAMLDIRKSALEAQVADGTLTQQEAESALSALEERQSLCDGTGSGLGLGNCGNGKDIMQAKIKDLARKMEMDAVFEMVPALPK